MEDGESIVKVMNKILKISLKQFNKTKISFDLTIGDGLRTK